MSTEHTVALLRALAYKYLASNALESAKFYAERLHYEEPTEDSFYLLALCYFRNNKVKQTYLILQQCGTSPMCRYLFALACEKLDKLEEGELALRPNGLLDPTKVSEEALRNTPGGAEGVYLLGRLCRRQHRKEMAVAYFKLCVRLDPYLWSAIAELSELGVAINMAELLNCTDIDYMLGGNVHTNGGLRQEEKAGWLQEAQASTHQQYFSARNVFRDNQRAEQHQAAEFLAGGSGAAAGGVLPSKVSMALGLSSMSLHVPFASPSSLPSPMMQHSAHHMTWVGTTGMNSTGLASGTMKSVPLGTADSHGSRASDHPGTDARRGHLQGARTTLFGVDTPGPTPGASSGLQAVSTGGLEGVMRGDAAYTAGSDGSAIRGVDLFGSSAPNSHAVSGAGHGQGQGRRVSFGPTARLSFSGALDAGVAPAQHLSVMQSFDGDSSMQLSGVEEGGDEYPFKQPRADGQVGSPSAATHRAAETSSRALPHKLLSPFPMEASPIPLGQRDDPASDGASVLGATHDGDGMPTPVAGGRRKYGARGTPGTGPATAENKESNRRDGGVSAGIAGVDDTFLGASGGAGSPPQASSHLSHLELNRLVITFSRAYQMLCTYCCRACINELQTQLPARHLRSGLASQWIGRALYEMNEYKAAALAFREMLRAEPFRVCGLETLSTALWHLRRDKELSALAQQVVDVDKLAPEAWCVVGNCFSLQKEPDTALKFFQRALQLDPTFVYAHTLCGHEQVNNEDLDKAVDSFRQAILHNDRHYNAWYGLGSIYYRQEKYELAEYHFRTALGINPASSVLHCYLGMALHAQGNAGKSLEALQVLTQAAEKDVNNPQLHFQRATILLAMGDLPAALEALLVVEDHAPREPPVHALLGQVYHRMGELQLAIKHLNTAMDLDPKEASSLKGILEHIDDPPMEQS